MENVVAANSAVNENYINYDKEQSDLLKTLLNERFFEPWREKYVYQKPLNNKTLLPESSLEIFITSTCNQHCTYCYLYNNKNIYPPEFNKKSLIINNLTLLLNWIEENQFFIPQVELFSGEIWHSSYGLEILEILYQALLRHRFTEKLTIPSNCSFVMDKSALAKIQRYIDKFKNIDIILQFSISVDGAIMEHYSRPLNNGKEKTEEFYEDLFMFAKHNNFAFHPMVSSYNVKHWIENYQWWMEKFNQYDFSLPALMMLEVRNNDWTDETIAQYCEFLDYLINSTVTQNFNNNTEEFLLHLLSLKESENFSDNYFPYALTEANNFASCSIASHLTVRLGDLALCPCHRTAYNKYLFGKFVIQDNKIVDIEGNNPYMAIRILMANNEYSSLGCDSCVYQKFCLKGCYGSQYENTGDPFLPVPSVCKFFKHKYDFLAKKYIDLGFYDIADKVTPYNLHFERIHAIKKFIRGVEQSWK